MDLVIYQGETTTLSICPKVDGEFYTLTSNDKIIFGIKSNVKDEDFAIYKILTTSNYSSETHSYVITLSSTETEALAAATYIYDVGLQVGNTTAANFYYIIKPSIIKVVGTITKNRGS